MKHSGQTPFQASKFQAPPRRRPRSSFLPAFLLLALTGPGALGSPPRDPGKPASPQKGPVVLALPSGVRFVLLDRPGEFLSFAATFVAAGISAEGRGEEGVSQVLATESLHGTWALGSPGWEREKSWLARRDRLLEKEARIRLQGKPQDPALEKEKANLTRLLMEQTRSLAWLARLEEEGGTGISSWADPSGFGLRLAIPSSHLARFLSLEAVRLRTPALRRILISSRTWRQKRIRSLREDSLLHGKSLLLGEAFRIHPNRRYLALPGPGPILWRRAQAFWKREVLPERIVLALVGPRTPGLDRWIRELWGKWPSPPDRPLPLAPTPEPPQEGPRILHTQVPRGEEGALVAWRLPPQADRAGLLLLAELLGNPVSGWIPGLLARDRGLFRFAAVEAPFPGPQPPSLFLVELTPRQGDDPDQAVDTLLQFLPTWSPTPAEIALARQRVLSNLEETRSSPGRLASVLAEEEATGRGAQAWWNLPERVKAFPPGKIRALAREIFQEKNRNLVLLEGPGKGMKQP